MDRIYGHLKLHSSGPKWLALDLEVHTEAKLESRVQLTCTGMIANLHLNSGLNWTWIWANLLFACVPMNYWEQVLTLLMAMIICGNKVSQVAKMISTLVSKLIGNFGRLRVSKSDGDFGCRYWQWREVGWWWVILMTIRLLSANFGNELLLASKTGGGSWHCLLVKGCRSSQWLIVSINSRDL